MRAHVAEQFFHHQRIGAIAADDAMPPELPDVARTADWIGRRLWSGIGVCNALCSCIGSRENPLDLAIVESENR